MKIFKNQKGFTLVELILTMTLVSILAAAGAQVLSPALDSWAMGSARGSSTVSGDYALGRMVEDIAKLNTANNVTTATASQFRFMDVDGNDIQYSLSNGNLMRSGKVLARDVQSLAFSYWDVNNNQLNSPTVSPAATNIWRVSIQLTLRVGNETVPFQTQLHPRNLKRS